MKTQLERKAAVAGKFYPNDEAELGTMVDAFLNSTTLEPAPERVSCIMVPHAGYVYSGPTAAFSFGRVRGKTVRRLILLGCSHYHRFEGASIVTGGNFETPLGAFPIDEPWASDLAERVGTVFSDPHIREHSLEVQLPFVARTLGLVPIVPILLGSEFTPWHTDFAKTLAESVDESDLLVVSTDLSHYLDEEQANRQDRQSLDILLSQDVDAVVKASRDGRFSMCGAVAVATAMVYGRERKASEWTLLDYRTSGHAAKDYSRVVGYAAVSMETAA